jgi:monoamine oxidase
MFIFYTPEVRDKFNYFINIHKFNRNVKGLLTFAFADYARQSETMSDDQVIDDIMVHLKDIYGDKIPRPIKILRTKWATDEYTYGSYSFTAVGTKMRHFEDLAEDIDKKLFFAGEHTNVDYFSTAHGAYLSGIREADKIISLSKKEPRSKNKK